jgi:hypothetical protein
MSMKSELIHVYEEWENTCIKNENTCIKSERIHVYVEWENTCIKNERIYV